MGLIASETGLHQVDQARAKRQWNKYAQVWYDKASVSEATLKRFWRRESLSPESFYSICCACGFGHDFISNVIIDWQNSTTSKESLSPLYSIDNLPPFGDKGCILDPNRFFERETIFKQLHQYLNSGWNCSLIGDFGTGKSSILRKLCQEGYQYLDLTPSSFIYFNLQLECRPQYLLDAFCQALAINSETCSNRFELQNLSGNQNFIICLDEIGSLKLLPDSDLQYLLGLLRALAESPSFSLVTASHLPLNQIFPHSAFSAFADIFHSIDIPYFTKDEARQFIHARLQNDSIQFTEQQIEQLYQDCQGHPAQLQEKALCLYIRLRMRNINH